VHPAFRALRAIGTGHHAEAPDAGLRRGARCGPLLRRNTSDRTIRTKHCATGFGKTSRFYSKQCSDRPLFAEPAYKVGGREEKAQAMSIQPIGMVGRWPLQQQLLDLPC
jgi:hypothetical protein